MSTRKYTTRRTAIAEALTEKLKELGVEETLINLKGMTQGMLVILGQKNIKKLSDFADLSSDELIGGFDEVKGKKNKNRWLFRRTFTLKERSCRIDYGSERDCVQIML